MLNLKLPVALSIVLTPVIAAAGTIVVPNANTSSAGNVLIAFGASGNPAPTIFQESFDPGQFTGPVAITEISFRPAPAAVTTPVAGHAPEVDWSFGNVSMYLSTSPNYPNSTSGPLMSATFANNVGPNNTLVFSGTNVTLSESICPGSGPCPFGLNIDFTTPFDYNPAAGSLLFEFVASGASIAGFGQGYGYLDGDLLSAPGGSMGAVFETGSTTATTGTFLYGGPIAQITFTPLSSAPEPASGMMVAGAIALLWMWRKRFHPNSTRIAGNAPSRSIS